MLAERTWLHGLDPRVKLAWSAAVAVSAALLARPAHLALLLAVTLLPWLWLRLSARLVGALLALAALATASLMVSQGLFYAGGQRTELLSLPFGLSLAREGLIYGAGQALRPMAIGAAALAVVACAEPSDLLTGLTRLGLPPGLSFMLVMALRFLPETLEQGQRILAFGRLRGLARGPLATLGWLLPTLLASLLRQARGMALAAEARGWTPARGPRWPMPLSAADHALLTGLVLMLAAAVWVALRGTP